MGKEILHGFVMILQCWRLKYFFFYLKDDVDNYMQNEEGNVAEGVLAKLDEQYQKYKFMEVNLIQKRLR